MERIVSWMVSSLLLSLSLSRASSIASGTSMSRASVISFLNRMTREGFLEHREVTDKGGHKRLYRPSPTAPDEGSFRRALAERIMRKVLEEIA